MKDNLIYDIGMNNGDDTAYYLSLGYEVIAIEAAPALVCKAEERFIDYIDKKQLTILNIGIAETEGYMDFYLNKFDSGWNSFYINLADRGGAGYETLKVQTRKIENVIREWGVPFYMKVDIEGYDRIVLESLLKCSEKPKNLSIELYDMDEIILLENLGYTKFRIIEQQSFLPLELPLSREYKFYLSMVTFKTSKNFLIRVFRKLFGSFVLKFMESKHKKQFYYPHTLGSSGPFGNNGFGKWYSFDEIKAVFFAYKNQFEQMKTNKENGLWIDIHATY